MRLTHHDALTQTVEIRHATKAAWRWYALTKAEVNRDAVYQKGVSPTLACTHGGEPAVCVQGSMIGRKDENGPQGNGINEDVSFTLNATDKHAVAYGIDRAAFNQGQNAKYSFAVEQEVQPTMVAKGPGAVAAPTYSSSKASFLRMPKRSLQIRSLPPITKIRR